ncbi:MAG: glycosyltransferase family 2 protein [Solirubrobacteraceae bacterium]
MLVTVVIPAYNAERFIEATVGTVLRQTHAELELLLVDDGSSDRTAEVVGRLGDERVRVMRIANGGTVAARNHGLAGARGELIAFLDHDDAWLEEKLARQIAVFASEPDAVAVGSLMHYVSDSGRRLGISGEDPRPPDRQELIRRGALMPVAMSSIVWRTAVIRRVGEFDPTIPQIDDLDMLTRVMRFGRMSFVAEPLGEHRIHRGSITTNNYRSQRMGARFFYARLHARAAGGDLSWDEFEPGYWCDWRARHSDRVAYWYRTAGLLAIEGRIPGAIGYASLAAIASPRYTFVRIRRQLLSRAARPSLGASASRPWLR